MTIFVTCLPAPAAIGHLVRREIVEGKRRSALVGRRTIRRLGRVFGVFGQGKVLERDHRTIASLRLFRFGLVLFRLSRKRRSGVRRSWFCVRRAGSGLNRLRWGHRGWGHRGLAFGTGRSRRREGLSSQPPQTQGASTGHGPQKERALLAASMGPAPLRDLGAKRVESSSLEDLRRFDPLSSACLERLRDLGNRIDHDGRRTMRTRLRRPRRSGGGTRHMDATRHSSTRRRNAVSERKDGIESVVVFAQRPDHGLQRD